MRERYIQHPFEERLIPTHKIPPGNDILILSKRMRWVSVVTMQEVEARRVPRKKIDGLSAFNLTKPVVVTKPEFDSVWTVHRGAPIGVRVQNTLPLNPPRI